MALSSGRNKYTCCVFLPDRWSCDGPETGRSAPGGNALTELNGSKLLRRWSRSRSRNTGEMSVEIGYKPKTSLWLAGRSLLGSMILFQRWKQEEVYWLQTQSCHSFTATQTSQDDNVSVPKMMTWLLTAQLAKCRMTLIHRMFKTPFTGVGHAILKALWLSHWVDSSCKGLSFSFKLVSFFPKILSSHFRFYFNKRDCQLRGRSAAQGEFVSLASLMAENTVAALGFCMKYVKMCNKPMTGSSVSHCLYKPGVGGRGLLWSNSTNHNAPNIWCYMIREWK